MQNSCSGDMGGMEKRLGVEQYQAIKGNIKKIDSNKIFT